MNRKYNPYDVLNIVNEYYGATGCEVTCFEEVCELHTNMATLYNSGRVDRHDMELVLEIVNNWSDLHPVRAQLMLLMAGSPAIKFHEMENKESVDIVSSFMKLDNVTHLPSSFSQAIKQLIDENSRLKAKETSEENVTKLKATISDLRWELQKLKRGAVQ